MAAHKRERKQAAVKVGTGFHVKLEMDSRWNLGSLVRWYVVLVLRWDVEAPQMRGYFYFLPLYSSLHIKASTVATSIMPSSKIPNTISQFITVFPRALGNCFL